MQHERHFGIIKVKIVFINKSAHDHRLLHIPATCALLGIQQLHTYTQKMVLIYIYLPARFYAYFMKTGITITRHLRDIGPEYQSAPEYLFRIILCHSFPV